jgi:adenylate cyclase class 2
MLEVEMKFPVADAAEIENRLGRLGAGEPAARLESDLYFNSPDRDFARTDEALRLRRIGRTNIVTYKGPKRDKQTKTRSEIEVVLAEGDLAAERFTRLIQSLGYTATAEVSKRRRIYHLHRDSFHVEICLDEVRDVGVYVELEIVAREEHEEQAKTVVQHLALELGLTASERRSYLELLLTARGAK